METLRQLLSDPLRKKAFIGLIAFSLLNTVLTYNPNTLDVTLIYLLLCPAFNAFAIYLILTLRGEEKLHRLKPQLVTSIGVWGYLWRSYIIIGTATLMAFLSLYWVFGFHSAGSSGTQYLALSMLALFCMPITCWLFFSIARQAQLAQLLTLFRGV
ncbi:MAG: hypothetical protein ABWY06_20985 [Pseudomonas sp.]|uniref:hypothetical protein n=1 Tax=Pseudomonas sp. TaxID=306 RepID=UPI0033961949